MFSVETKADNDLEEGESEDEKRVFLLEFGERTLSVTQSSAGGYSATVCDVNWLDLVLIKASEQGDT